jgi:hypothetical protein
MTTDTFTPEDDPLAVAKRELENVLIQILGMVGVLRNLNDPGGDLEVALSYLANQLEEHRDAAMDVYCRIFGLNKYTKRDGGPGALVVSTAHPSRESDSKLLSLLEQRDRLVAEANSKENSDEKIGEEASNALVSAIGKKVAKIDHRVADMVASTAIGLIGQVALLEDLNHGPFTDDDADHQGECSDRLVASIKAGIERLAGA